ncbi:hypothetical protein ASC72_06160 [Flavobacterium sp. Root420]|nr:hypothetical protein ASC72_06160 [Flavobacterium sp. Root420]
MYGEGVTMQAGYNIASLIGTAAGSKLIMSYLQHNRLYISQINIYCIAKNISKKQNHPRVIVKVVFFILLNKKLKA